MHRHIAAIAALALVAALLVACGGRTTGATINADGTVTLNGSGYCEPGDNGFWYFEYRDASHPDFPWSIGNQHRVDCPTNQSRTPTTGEAPLTDNVGSLAVGTYEYRVVFSWDTGQTAWADKNGAGNGTQYHTFTVGTQPPPTGKTGPGFWLTASEVASLPTSGTPWTNTVAAADAFDGTVTLSDQNDNSDVEMLAQAIVGKRLNDTARINEVKGACTGSQNTENGGRVLAVARNLPSFVAACGIVGQDISSWVSGVRTEAMTECTSIKACSEVRPNNWGTMSHAARAAASSYLNDRADLDNLWGHYQDWLGRANGGYDFSSPAETYSCLGALTNLRGVEPPGCTKSGVNLDGVTPDDARRCGAFTSPPCLSEPYDYEARQGMIVAAVILARAGYPVAAAQSQAVHRTYQYLQRLGRAPQGDDTWQPWLEQCLGYTPSFTPSDSATRGKNMGWVALSHRVSARCAP